MTCAFSEPVEDGTGTYLRCSRCRTRETTPTCNSKVTRDCTRLHFHAHACPGSCTVHLHIDTSHPGVCMVFWQIHVQSSAAQAYSELAQGHALLLARATSSRLSGPHAPGRRLPCHNLAAAHAQNAPNLNHLLLTRRAPAASPSWPRRPTHEMRRT